MRKMKKTLVVWQSFYSQLMAGWFLQLTDCVGPENLAMGRTCPSEAVVASLALQISCLILPGWQSFLDVWSPGFPAGGLS